MKSWFGGVRTVDGLAPGARLTDDRSEASYMGEWPNECIQLGFEPGLSDFTPLKLAWRDEGELLHGPHAQNLAIPRSVRDSRECDPPITFFDSPHASGGWNRAGRSTTVASESITSRI